MKESLILIIYEDREDLVSLTECFSADYQVVAARSGKEALDFLEASNVDVILSNLRINDMTGLDIFSQSRVTHPEAVRILVAEHQDLEEINRDVNDGAIYQVIRKPWHPTALRLMIRRALESRELSRRHRYLNRALKFSDAIWDKDIGNPHASPKNSLEFDKLVFVSE
ncbi:MAG: response regulator, partial [Acidobacteriota bacterium]